MDTEDVFDFNVELCWYIVSSMVACYYRRFQGELINKTQCWLEYLI